MVRDFFFGYFSASAEGKNQRLLFRLSGGVNLRLAWSPGFSRRNRSKCRMQKNFITFDDAAAWLAKAGTPCPESSARSPYANLNDLILVSDSRKTTLSS
jgi:hypothetical protein